MNPEILTSIINIVSITVIVTVMIYYSLIFKKTSQEINKIKADRQLQ